MKLQKITKLNQKSKKRFGRGCGSGRGKTAGRGTKGQKSRSGFNLPRRFEGGQTSLIQRSPKKGGFKTPSKLTRAVINLGIIDKTFKEGETVSPKTLLTHGLIKSDKYTVKILGNGKLSKNIKFRNCLMSKKVKDQASK